MATNYKTNQFFLHFSQIILGLVFLFSGFVKAIDPLGGTYKFEDYLHAFGGIFIGISAYSFYFAVALSTLELLIGLNLLFGVQIKRTAIVALLFMLVMTPLTLYIAISNPVSDCGCFGEALKISNWETFWKNIVLVVLIIILIKTSRTYQNVFLGWIESLLMMLFIGIGIGLSVWTYNHLPIIDFLPYKTQVNITEAMQIPENAPRDSFETTFIYEQKGIQKEFTLANYPQDDSTWTFVDQKTTLIKEGYKPEIHDLFLYNTLGDDVLPELLAYEGYTYWLVMYDVTKASVEGAKKAEEIYQKYKNSSVRFYALTTSGDQEIAAFRAKTNISFDFLKGDGTPLKSLVRANPGLMLIKNGTILGKWNWKDF